MPNATVSREFYAMCRKLKADGAKLYCRGLDYYICDGTYCEWVDYIVVAHIVGEFRKPELGRWIIEFDNDDAFLRIAEGVTGGSGRYSNQVRAILRRIFGEPLKMPVHSSEVPEGGWPGERLYEYA